MGTALLVFGPTTWSGETDRYTGIQCSGGIAGGIYKLFRTIGSIGGTIGRQLSAILPPLTTVMINHRQSLHNPAYRAPPSLQSG